MEIRKEVNTTYSVILDDIEFLQLRNILSDFAAEHQELLVAHDMFHRFDDAFKEE